MDNCMQFEVMGTGSCCQAKDRTKRIWAEYLRLCAEHGMEPSHKIFLNMCKINGVQPGPESSARCEGRNS